MAPPNKAGPLHHATASRLTMKPPPAESGGFMNQGPEQPSISLPVSRLIRTLRPSDEEKTPPHEDEIRRRILHGQRRRRQEAAGPGKRTMRGLRTVLQAMVFYTTAVAAHTADTLSGPTQDLWEVFQSQHTAPQEDHSRADFLEIFAGGARISQAVARLKGAALEPRDQRYGHNLYDRHVQDEIYRKVVEEKPKLSHGAFLQGRAGASRPKGEPDTERKAWWSSSTNWRDTSTAEAPGLGSMVLHGSATYAEVDLHGDHLTTSSGWSLKWLWEWGGDASTHEAMVTHTEDRPNSKAAGHSDEEDPVDAIIGANAITFKGKVNPAVAKILKRLHQNLGHPPNREFVKHLRLGGAGPAMIQVVAVDVIWLEAADSEGADIPALNMVDVASTYQVVYPMAGTKSEDAAQAFMQGWVQWAGAPRFVIADLDSAFKDQFLTRLDQLAVHIRCAAGQAHWQNSVAERQGESWKAIWKKHTEDNLILKDEAAEAIAAINSAKNGLRNRSGYSPRQWVFGANQRLPGDPFDAPDDLTTADSKFARSQLIRLGARTAFCQVQASDTLRRAAAHRPRVEALPFEPGSLVYVFRNVRPGKGKKPAPTWIGPATVLGREGSNYWTSRGGRCMLVAAEHLRAAEHEEVSEYMRLRLAMELAEFIKNAGPEDAHMDVEIEMEAPAEPDPRIEEVEQREEIIASAGRRRGILDDVPASLKRLKTTYMAARRRSEKGKAKQLEKELPWHLIPDDEKPLYMEAEKTQWEEHIAFEAVRPLSLTESKHVMDHEDPARILNARFAYKDTRHAQRRLDPTLAPKPKARLCVSGQNDPDLGVADMSTDAPTANRHSVLMALQLALARGWKVSVGDVRAAFLTHAGQLVEIVKGVFGLATSPKLWWMKLSGDLKNMRVQGPEAEVRIEQNTIDSCCFMLVGVKTGKVRGLLLTHVDDLLLLTEEALRLPVQTKLKELFPVDDWEDDCFSYVGCEYECTAEAVVIKQRNYCETRVDKVTVPPGVPEDTAANQDQIEENRTAIGSVSWLAKMTRPDLQFQVSQAQRRQNAPTVRDLKETNKLVDAARAGADRGLTLHRVAEEDLVLVAFHDAAWANVQNPDVTEEDLVWNGEHTLSSQLAFLVVVCDRRSLEGGAGKFGIVEWRSKASQRVCRSTFAGETMACSDALEAALFLRGLLVSLQTGQAVPESVCGKFLEVHMVTDCKSFYDHVHREGTPKAPTEKRLALDLASIRQILSCEVGHQWSRRHGDTGKPSPEKPARPPLHWVPTHEQLADVLTKKMSAEGFWNAVEGGLISLPLLRRT
ncbi:RE1 [Symbiodinium sp. CCMP2592]|nr:RE1 [Symbiodinium sp. CCMP2592]